MDRCALWKSCCFFRDENYRFLFWLSFFASSLLLSVSDSLNASWIALLSWISLVLPCGLLLLCPRTSDVRLRCTDVFLLPWLLPAAFRGVIIAVLKTNKQALGSGWVQFLFSFSILSYSFLFFLTFFLLSCSFFLLSLVCFYIWYWHHYFIDYTLLFYVLHVSWFSLFFLLLDVFPVYISLLSSLLPY